MTVGSHKLGFFFFFFLMLILYLDAISIVRKAHYRVIGREMSDLMLKYCVVKERIEIVAVFE